MPDAAQTTDPVGAYLETPTALLARMAEVRGHIEDMGSGERVFMLGALAGSLESVLASIEAALELHQPTEGQHPDFCGEDGQEMPCRTRKAIAVALLGEGSGG